MELCVVEDYEIAAWFVFWIFVEPQLKHLTLASVLNYGTYNKMLGIKKGKKNLCRIISENKIVRLPALQFVQYCKRLKFFVILFFGK